VPPFNDMMALTHTSAYTLGNAFDGADDPGGPFKNRTSPSQPAYITTTTRVKHR
jgi:hypothetical protein